jgi:hypothetical protein
MSKSIFIEYDDLNKDRKGLGGNGTLVTQCDLPTLVEGRARRSRAGNEAGQVKLCGKPHRSSIGLRDGRDGPFRADE